MKSLSISVLLLILGLSCGVNATAQSSKKAVHPTTAESNETIQQRFNPIFGSEKESNNLLSFIASNMVLELDANAVKNIDGLVVVNFYLDTLGNIDRMSIIKSLRPWIDYAIIDGMKKLPAYGRPSMRNNGKIYESRHDIVFSFGSYIRVGGHSYGYKAEQVSANIQSEIDHQRGDHFAKINEQQRQWNKFTTKNSRLEYDTKSGLKNQAPTLSPDDRINTPSNLPPLTPTVTINNKD